MYSKFKFNFSMFNPQILDNENSQEKSLLKKGYLIISN